MVEVSKAIGRWPEPTNGFILGEPGAARKWPSDPGAMTARPLVTTTAPTPRIHLERELMNRLVKHGHVAADDVDSMPLLPATVAEHRYQSVTKLDGSDRIHHGGLIRRSHSAADAAAISGPTSISGLRR
jgi:hypothetical protein